MRRNLVFLSCSAVAACSSGAWAQSGDRGAAATTGGDADAIIVTGEKADRTLMETPTSVAITTPKRIAQENILTIQDVYARTANVAETYGASGFTIRGINNQGASGGGNADTATVYLDGAPLPREALFGGPTDLWDVAQVEILRGPQSTIQGLNALAGAIVIATKDPTMRWTADGRLLWTDQMDRSFSAAVGGPIVPDQLAFRVSAERRADRGVIENVTRGGHDDRLRSLNLRGKILWTPTALPDLSVKGGYNRVRRTGGYLFQYTDISQPDYYDHRRQYSDQPNRGLVKSDIATLDIGYRLSSALRLTNITSYSRIHTDVLADGDNTAVNAQSIHNVYTTRTVTDELRLNYDQGRLSGLLGGWFAHRAQSYYADSRVNVPTPAATIQALLQGGGLPAATAAAITSAYTAQLPVIPISYHGELPTTVTTLAAFGDARYRLTDRLSLIAGFRYDHERNHASSSSIATFTGTYPNPASFGAALAPAISAINAGVAGIVASASSTAPPDTRDFNAFLPKGGISMDWTPHLNTSLTVQRGYRSGGEGQNQARASLVPYDPEYTTNVEGSLRSTWLGGRLSLNANIFYTHWVDQQVSVNRGLNVYDINTVNAGKSHLWGFEVEAAHRFSTVVDVYANVGHVKTKFDDFKLPAGTTAQVNLAGSEFAYAPHWTAAGGVNLHVQPGFTGNFNVNWRSGVFTGVGLDQNGYRVGPRAVANAKIGFEQKHWGAYLYARNLFDTHYQQYVYAAIHQAILGAPRTIGGELDLHW
jgi:iron complex outermembrane recepter protein